MAAGILLIMIGVVAEWQFADQPYNLKINERSLMIRNRAGNRAYWVSAALVYLGLIWASFAAKGNLPELSNDLLWYYLAAGFVIPFGVYAVSIVIDQRNS